jgi:hypothetical protein
MIRTRFTFVGTAALLLAAGSFAFAQSTTTKQKESKPTTAAAQHEMGQDMPLPPGWTQEDMMKCQAAATPGPMQAVLTRDAGTWQGKSKMWMGPGAEATESVCTSTVTPMFDGRYVKVEIQGDMGGMPFNGFGIYGYDNVSERFQGSWIDNCGTGVMYGVGELSSDGDTLTWTYGYTCPITNKKTTMREVETRTGPNTKTFQIFTTDPKSGKEYKMLDIAYTRTSKDTDAHAMASPGMFSDSPAEIGCGRCSYHMAGVSGCTPAVKINGQTYVLSGVDVNFHQFCAKGTTAPATVSGKVVDGKLVATKVETDEEAH